MRRPERLYRRNISNPATGGTRKRSSNDADEKPKAVAPYGQVTEYGRRGGKLRRFSAEPGNKKVPSQSLIDMQRLHLGGGPFERMAHYWTSKS